MATTYKPEKWYLLYENTDGNLVPLVEGNSAKEFGSANALEQYLLASAPAALEKCHPVNEANLTKSAAIDD